MSQNTPALPELLLGGVQKATGEGALEKLGQEAAYGVVQAVVDGGEDGWWASTQQEVGEAVTLQSIKNYLHLNTRGEGIRGEDKEGEMWVMSY